MSRRRGNLHENAFMEMAEKLGYAAFAARGSRGVVDVLCFQDSAVWERGAEPLLPLVVQVGTTAKPIEARCIVARRHRAKNRRISWTFHDRTGKYDTLEAMLRVRP